MLWKIAVVTLIFLSSGCGQEARELKSSRKSEAIKWVNVGTLVSVGPDMEAEVVDSMTGEQIGAVVESKKGSKMPFANLGKWDAAKQVMDDWAKRFQKRLEEVR